MGSFFPTEEKWLFKQIKNKQDQPPNKQLFINGKYKYNDPWNENESAFQLEFDDNNLINGTGTDSQRGHYVIKGKYSTSNQRISFTKKCSKAENLKSWDVRLEWNEEEQLFKGKEKLCVKVSCLNNATVYDCTIKYVN